MPSAADRGAEREEMVRRQLAARGVADAAVLAAMAEVPREVFVPEDLAAFAYQDGPLPIGYGQTISQPYVVARMAEALELRPGDRVLEVGTGSGYAAAVLSRVAHAVFTVERHAPLAAAARERLRRLGYDGVTVRHADGTGGWAEHAPYDAVMAAAAPRELPAALSEQLAVGGRLVAPVGDPLGGQSLLRVRRAGPADFRTEDLGPVRFVPLLPGTGEERRE